MKTTRPRIQPQPEKVISARGRIVFSRESKEQQTKAKEHTDFLKRRDNFMKNRNKVDCVEVVTTELLNFNFGCAAAITAFRERKKLQLS